MEDMGGSARLDLGPGDPMSYLTLRFATIAAMVFAVAQIPQYASAVLADAAGRI